MGIKDFIARNSDRNIEQDDHLSVPDGGRYGVETTIVGDFTPMSTEPTAFAVTAALAGGGIDFDIAGESFRPDYPDNLHRLAQVLQVLEGPEWPTALLVRDPANEYDANAIAVHIVGEFGHVGFVPRDLASILAPMMDRGDRLGAAAIEVRVNDRHPDRPGLTVAVWSA